MKDPVGNWEDPGFYSQWHEKSLQGFEPGEESSLMSRKLQWGFCLHVHDKGDSGRPRRRLPRWCRQKKWLDEVGS